MSLIQESEILDLVKNEHRWIDVRAPVEFLSGTIPNSENAPLLDDEERRLVGTCYKTQGRNKAIELGHQLVSGENKDRKIQSWIQEIKRHPNLSLYCFRGGMRSQISQQWLKEAGFFVRRVSGGYKDMRRLLTQHFRQQVENTTIHLISGPTGSLKTHLIQWLISKNHLSLDLEQHANHRGSAFGKCGPQPQQVNFEHTIVKEILKKDSLFKKGNILYLEDESRLIGKCVLPDFLFAKMRLAPILWIDEPIQQRVENIFSDYIVQTDIVRSQNEDRIRMVYKGYLEALVGIKKRLGLEKFLEIHKDILSAEVESLRQNSHDLNRIWIQKLLVSYYDPLYLSSLARRDPKILFKASASDVQSFISQ